METNEGGNPLFNIADVEPTEVLSAVTREDLELEMALQRSHEDEIIGTISDNGPVVEVKPEKFIRELLSDVLTDTEPAATITELNNQVHLAKEMDCDSIEATPALVRSFNRKHYPDDVGYFIYHDIKVYIAGFHAVASKRDKETVESRLFKDSKIVGQPVMTMDKK